MKILIVEDDAIFASGLEIKLEQMKHQIAGIASSSDDALRLIRATQPDLVLMDIHIKGVLDGIEVAEQMKKLQLTAPVIFITSMQSTEVFNRAKTANPFAYITKPVDTDALHRAIELALYKQASKISEPAQWAEDAHTKDSFFVKSGRQIQKVNIPDIHYLEVERKYSTITLANEQIKVRMPFKELTQKLPESRFIKVHKSFMVNIAKIDRVDIDEDKVIAGGQAIPLSRKYKKDLLSRLGRL